MTIATPASGGVKRRAGRPARAAATTAEPEAGRGARRPPRARGYDALVTGDPRNPPGFDGTLGAALARAARGRVLVVTGAGISAESGIPTYRGAGGLWRTVDFARLATPEAFAADRALVWRWYQERRAGVRAAQPNAAHAAVAELRGLARELLVVTQNVDDLHERAGLDPRSLVHVHGRILESRCVDCGASSDAQDDDERRTCAGCAGGLRPGVVWFGEALPEGEVARVERWIARGACDLVLSVGTTASFGYLVDWIERAAGERGRIADVDPGDSALARALPGRVAHLRERATAALAELVKRAREAG